MPQNKLKKITFDEFELLCEKGVLYAGLVDNLGLVSWNQKLIYFVRVKGKYGQSFYQFTPESQSFYYKLKGYEVITKTKHNLCVIPLNELEYIDKAAYQKYYDYITPLKRDAIPDYSPSIDDRQWAYNDKSSTKKVLEAGSAINKKTGLPLDITEKITGNKLLDCIGKGLTAVSIINDIVEGEYISASGNAIKMFSGWYGTTWDIGSAIYNTDYMQTELSRSLWREYLFWEAAVKNKRRGTIFGSSEEMARKAARKITEHQERRRNRK